VALAKPISPVLQARDSDADRPQPAGLTPHAPGSIASFGHAPVQAPQSTQDPASITNLGAPSLMASTGQESLHAPQQVHLLVMT
jgi:hypothetical protein